MVEVLARRPGRTEGLAISGKYGPGDQPVYALKRQFQDAGQQVLFPWGDCAKYHFSGYTFSAPDEQYYPFRDMQHLFLDAIDKAPYHIVCTEAVLSDSVLQHGYAGFSTSHEVCYAMAQGKPIVVTSPIEQISRYVPQSLFDILESKKQLFHVPDPRLTAETIKSFLATLPDTVDYDLAGEERTQIQGEIATLLRIEMHRWRSWVKKVRRDFQAGKRDTSIKWLLEETYDLEDRAYYLPLVEALNDEAALAYARYRD